MGTKETPESDSAARAELGLTGKEFFELALGPVTFAALLRLHADRAAGRVPGVVFSGSLSVIAVPDALSIVHSLGRDGILTFALDDSFLELLRRGPGGG